jgi:hypothetical protein
MSQAKIFATPIARRCASGGKVMAAAYGLASRVTVKRVFPSGDNPDNEHPSLTRSDLLTPGHMRFDPPILANTYHTVSAISAM